MNEIKIDKIIRSARRTVALHVLADASLVVRAPHRASMEYLQELVESKSEWILKKQKFFLSKRENFKPREFRSGELFPFLGRYIALELVDSGKRRIWLDGNLKMTTACLLNPSVCVKKWYMITAKAIFTPRVKLLAQTHGFMYRSVRINSAATRWGSCGPKNSLNFSWRLIAAPLDVIDSVILHELVHTEIKNHSSKFYNRLSAVMPGHKEKEKWLKDNSGILML